MTDEEKFEDATSGHNGLWLCQNHHKLFDTNILLIDDQGQVKLTNHILDSNKKFIISVTKQDKIQELVLSPEFLQYVVNRNKGLDITHVQSIL